MGISLPGVPEGMEVVRIGIAGPDDFELSNLNGAPAVRRGKREGSFSQIIVRPLPGYEFEVIKSIGEPWYRLVTLFDPPRQLEVTFKFGFRTVQDLNAADALMKQLQALPGYVSSSERTS